MRKSFARAGAAGAVLLVAAVFVPTVNAAPREREDTDDASSRRQAMDEWYNESYDSQSANLRRLRGGHGKPLWTPAYERFMRDAAQRERMRYATSLPQSGSTEAAGDMISPMVATGTSWANIGPTKANYAKNGGTLVVQYNVMEGGFFGGNPKLLEGIGPYPITLSQGRVTVEDSQVEFAATHPLMSKPNRIAAKDFDGWVQERGLYFASAFDAKYETLFSMHDPGEKPMTGGTLYARYGKGDYVFTPLSWFRQLTAGVPVAYRIFAQFSRAGQTRCNAW